MKGLQPPTAGARGSYSVNKPGQQEVIYNPLYDYQTYALAGQSSLTFFQVPNGQSSKTFEDTNMETAGSLPSPQSFICTGICVDFFPAALPGRTGAAAQIGTNWNDVYEVFQTGYLEFNIGSKNYLRDAPIGKFPPHYRLAGAAAQATTVAADATTLDYASVAGAPYNIIPFTIPQTQNFKVTMIWDTVIAITANARIGVTLQGFLYRDAQ